MMWETIFNENIEEMSEEMIANKILLYSEIDYENIPIRIDDVLSNFEFNVVRAIFADDDMVAGMAYREVATNASLTNRYLAILHSSSVEDTRYLMALAISHFVLESQNEYYNKPIYMDALKELDTNRAGRVARAILMPQKSMATLLMSPFVSKDDTKEKIDKVSRAFLVSIDVAKLRMKEVGFLN